MVEPVLSAKDIVAGYGEVNILQGTSIDVYEREIVCILGPNGAGKSTLLKTIAGLLRPRAGRVLLTGHDITGLPAEKLVSAGLAYVPQLGNVFTTMTVDENLDMGAYLLDPRKSEIARERVRSIFPVLGERARERVGRMSGGQRQMVAIGRALMMDPKVLLLDEPSAGLAPQLQELVFSQARRIADAGTPILLVEQNAKRALKASDRGYVLDQGQNRYAGTGAALLADPNVGKLYLGSRPD